MNLRKYAALALGALMLLGGAVTAAPATAQQSSGSMFIDPANTTVGPGSTFTAYIITDATVPTSLAQASLEFDPTILQITDVQRGADYLGSEIVTSAGSLEQARSDANATGILLCVNAFFLPGSGPAPAGEAEFLAITFAVAPGVTAGSSVLHLSDAPCGGVNGYLLLSDADANFVGGTTPEGDPVGVPGTDGSVTIAAGAPPVQSVATPAPETTSALGGEGTPASGTPELESTVLSGTTDPNDDSADDSSELADDDGGGGTPWLLIVAGLGVLVAAGGGAFYYMRNRKSWS